MDNEWKSKIENKKKHKQGKFLFLKTLMNAQSREGKSNTLVTEDDLEGIIGNKDMKSLYSKLNTENLIDTSYKIINSGKGYMIIPKSLSN